MEREERDEKRERERRGKRGKRERDTWIERTQKVREKKSEVVT